MELRLGYEAIDSYKRLAYKAWYALAEFVDNSTQSYKNNEDVLSAKFEEEKTCLRVDITYNNDPTTGFIQIEDNSIGMDNDDLVRSLTIGKKPEIQSGRSKYGLGLKTAAFWFGNRWEIITKKLGSTKEYHVIVDLVDLLSKQARREEILIIQQQRELTDPEKEELANSNQLEYTEQDAEANIHKTIVRISKLNRGIYTQTASKIKNYLRSMYRYDIKEGRLILTFQNEVLTWDDKDLMNRILTDELGNKFYKALDLDVNGKRVTGWAGILEVGSRKDAGFSLLQAKRVIQGWPDSYRPPKLFGEQEGGSNTYPNQRLFGELFLDGFDVSHTKDEILFSDNEEEILDQKLLDSLADYKKAANEYRKPVVSDEDENPIDYKSIVTNLFTEMQNPAFAVAVRHREVLSQDIILESNEEYFTRTTESNVKERYEAQIAGIKVTVIINLYASVYDPYLVIRFRASETELSILINGVHPHFKKLNTGEMIFDFIKHCIYDGLSEWKANWRVNSLEPETIKMIKDHFLRQVLTIN